MTESLANNGRRVWAVVAARSGSKGLSNKNIRSLAGTPLISHSIRFALKTGFFERVMLTTDSAEYAAIGEQHGAWVPFLRSPEAAADTSMEEHILEDMDRQLAQHGITPPDAIVWFRPTFPFRAIADLRTALDLLDDDVDAVRLVVEGEPRLYTLTDGYLNPTFDDGGRSMIRRQEFKPVYKVFHTDIFWYRNIKLGVKFLGDRVRGVPVHKICGIDVDSIEDFELAEAIIQAGATSAQRYINP
ncbi:acylneuraminate cytidylyltransferase family protein [Ancylobacter sp. WKF20]|uniref:acylneuraminate cytidylyltransferase family protein n=1 Tax=Ancylobacter sp. WKF20 TaxID=3039801 RepID=UPI00243422AD|nr:acylneuraminate cytidylyltransferase family protein [Ancylobacter sp. WKF20]WGD28996.1 acylneuraminate cytidylyltransferase family protein [Ancylobacter sp. WKF20]